MLRRTCSRGPDPLQAVGADRVSVHAQRSVDDDRLRLADELGINVVDLGLVYGVHVDDGNVATLDITLTSAACPLTDVIEDQTNSALSGLVTEARINWVWMPPWVPTRSPTRVASSCGRSASTSDRGWSGLVAPNTGSGEGDQDEQSDPVGRRTRLAVPPRA